MIQEGVVDFGGLAMVDGVLPEQQVRHECIHGLAQSGLESRLLFGVVRERNHARDIFVGGSEFQAALFSPLFFLSQGSYSPAQLTIKRPQSSGHQCRQVAFNEPLFQILRARRRLDEI